MELDLTKWNWPYNTYVLLWNDYRQLLINETSLVTRYEPWTDSNILLISLTNLFHDVVPDKINPQSVFYSCHNADTSNNIWLDNMTSNGHAIYHTWYGVAIVLWLSLYTWLIQLYKQGNDQSEIKDQIQLRYWLAKILYWLRKSSI